MDTFINNLLNVMTPQLVLYIVAALLAIIVLTVVLKGMKKRSLKSGLVDLETRYNEIKGIPLAFKFNKAVALSRVNEAKSLSPPGGNPAPFRFNEASNHPKPYRFQHNQFPVLFVKFLPAVPKVGPFCRHLYYTSSGAGNLSKAVEILTF